MTQEQQPDTSDSTSTDVLGVELESVLRHVIALAQRAAQAQGHEELLGAGVQLIYAKSGVRLMSIKADIDPRNHELLSAGALVRASSASAPGAALDLLTRIDQLIAQALARCLEHELATTPKN